MDHEGFFVILQYLQDFSVSKRSAVQEQNQDWAPERFYYFVPLPTVPHGEWISALVHLWQAGHRLRRIQSQ